MSLRLALAIAFALSAAACQFVPSAGIDQARAVELAERHARPIDRLLEARPSRAADLPELATAGLPPDTLVWRVSFASSEVRPCGPAPGRQCRIDSKTVIIDATTGAVVASEESGSTVP